MRYAYLSNGHLFLSLDGADPIEIESEFARQVMERHADAVQRRKWRGQGDGETNPLGYNLWGNAGPLEETTLVRIESATLSPDGRFLYYFLRTESVGGLFRYDIDAKEEVRIFHKTDVNLADLIHHPKEESMLCSVSDGEGRSIGMLGTERFNMKVLTEGDSIDMAPSWIPEKGNAIVFQSAGIGRNQNGQFAGVASFCIEMANLDTGETQTLLEDPRYDYLCPKMDKDGHLYCIRRPYYETGRRVSHMSALKDFLLVPFRLLKAFFGFLNVMSQIFGKQSLTNATTGQRKNEDTRAMFIKGRMIEISATSAAKNDESPIPDDWELIKVDSTGRVRTLQKKVSDFGFKSADGLVYTNGRSIYLHGDAKRDQMHRSKSFIDAVVLL